MILPLIAASLHISAMWIGIMGSMVTLVPMLGSVAFGRWIDRGGALLPVLSCCLLLLAGSLVFTFYPAFPTLLLIACLFGAGSVFGHVASTRAVGELGEGDLRARNLGYLTASYAMLQFLCPVLIGFVYDHLGPKGALLALGGNAVLALLLLAVTRHNYRRIRGRPERDGMRAKAGELLRLPELRRWSIISGISSSALTFMPFVVSLHVVSISATASDAGLILGGFALGTVVSRLGLSVLYRALGPNVLLFLSLTISAALYAVFPVLDRVAALFVLSVVMGGFLGLGVPVSLTLVYDASPRGRINESLGVCTALTNLMQTVTPLTLGLASSGVGLGPLVWLIAAIMVGSGFYALSGRGVPR